MLPVTHVFFLAGEPSGDLYASLVARALRESCDAGPKTFNSQLSTPSSMPVRVTGVGGPAMSAAGVELIESWGAGPDVRCQMSNVKCQIARPSPPVPRLPTSGPGTFGVFGFWEGIKSAGRMRGFVRRMSDYLATRRPDVFVPVSYSGVNLHLARRAHRLGIRVVYLSPPQLWAWGRWRSKTLRDNTDKVICLLPFEEPFLRSLGVNAFYLGNPLMDGLAAYRSPPAAPENSQSAIPNLQSSIVNLPSDFSPHAPCPPFLVLMPGSRVSEIRSHLSLMLEVARRLQYETPDLRIRILASGDLIRNAGITLPPNLQSLIFNLQSSILNPQSSIRYALMSRADLILAASGTATLEAAILQVPMIVLYRLSPLSLLAARAMVRLKHFSLPNLILDPPTPESAQSSIFNLQSSIVNRRLVPEFLQPRADEVFFAARELLTDANKRAEMRAALAQVTAGLGEPGAAKRIARAILGLA